jgi:hypothetical protein
MKRSVEAMKQKSESGWLVRAAMLAMLAGVFAPGLALAGKAQVAAVQATRGAINAAANKTGAQVRFCLSPERAQSAKSPAKVTVSIGIFDEAKTSQSNAADPALWSLYE